ncbi:MAG: hypothetical protein ICV64_03205 [Thermoleophilia bacterium]|nr:hypothetical protein [Thermoleophilia bacterium]
MDLGDDRDASILGGADEGAPDADAAAQRQAEPVVHRLEAPTREAAEALAAIVRNYGYEIEVAGSSVTASRYEAAQDDELLADARELLRELAAEHGGSYEGSAPDR